MPRLALLVGVLLWAGSAAAGELRIDFAKPAGKFRPLHGVNGGPINAGGTIDLTKHWRQLEIPITRLHDCEWPSGRVVDMHSVFPSLAADPRAAASYRFEETDDYLDGVTSAGAKIVYRLGESIEHSPRKYHVHPPRDYDAWSAAALGIIRHYNEGWAGGKRLGIEYWEVWNEPENRPACWTGTDADYYRLYRTAGAAIKKEFPHLKVGGPAVGASGDFVAGVWRPTEFMQGFLDDCRMHKTPLDFFSWHTYTNDPSLYRRKAAALRKWLDDHGFEKTELHLNEWNYLPGNDWSGLARESQGERRAAWYAEQGGPAGAAFTLCVLLDLQDSTVDVANFFHGDASTFGLFTQYGEPKKTFYAFDAFRQLLDTQRVEAAGSVSGELAVAAGVAKDGTSATIVVANFRHQDAVLELSLENVPFQQPAVEIRRLDARASFEKPESGAVAQAKLKLHLPAPGALIVRLRER